MLGLLKTIVKIFTYKEPPNEEGFELLEGKNEGKNIEFLTKQQDLSKVETISKERKESKEPKKKQPLTIEEWNNSKNNESDLMQKNSENVVSESIDNNITYVKRIFKIPQNQDVYIREFKIAYKTRAFLLFVDGMVDKTTINNIILRELLNNDKFVQFYGDCPVEYISNNVLSIYQVSIERDFKKITVQVLSGNSALFIDGCAKSLIIESRGYEKRSVEKPVTESVIRGSQEGFSENLRTNITLLRKIIKNENLVTEIHTVGKTDNSSCAILYLDGVANPRLINEVRRRIKSINIDFISGNGMIEEMIGDQPLMIFPQISTTERPDRTASLIMDGKVVFITEGTPFAGSVPTNFFELVHSPEDYFLKWQFGTFLRFIRLIGIAASAILPGLYIALVTFHQDVIPTDLLLSIVESRENIPFPTVIELLLMEISFELIREAGLRVPGAIGTTLGIIGALILGQAAVAANIVSPVLIIVVAVTGIGSFVIPNYTLGFALRISRFIFIAFGALFGFYGISASLAALLVILCGMKSFGIPFFTPVAPKTNSKPDTIIEQPVFRQKDRIDFVQPLDNTGAGENPRGWTDGKEGDEE